MQPAAWTPPPPSDGGAQSGCLHAFLFAIAAVWVASVTIVAQGAAWFYDQYQSARYGTPAPGWFWLAVALGQALLLALPVLPLALAVRAPRFRAAYQAWGVAIGFGLLLSLARLCPTTWTQPAAVAQIILSLLATFALTK